MEWIVYVLVTLGIFWIGAWLHGRKYPDLAAEVDPAELSYINNPSMGIYL